jgi:hypothetical protein
MITLEGALSNSKHASIRVVSAVDNVAGGGSGVTTTAFAALLLVHPMTNSAVSMRSSQL